MDIHAIKLIDIYADIRLVDVESGRYSNYNYDLTIKIVDIQIDFGESGQFSIL